ncbi:carboxypeptidase-like regulatory domain-containing protein [Algoriphagus aquimarinus]|uniref:Carboxypeptidase-like regulatory domain-containing protein n=1 Tax=Algoriphagus aquimarinus TaxID=237018 RepID=A0A5C7B0I9_9BACT|nr:carboxypeptidase-like regulatory domain-containing protein [Algoriphagus aquimarinus]TXE11372.1 carboxypeptidase-like regulatory domain-containing protein [Algoriphagus aquimarinus]
MHRNQNYLLSFFFSLLFLTTPLFLAGQTFGFHGRILDAETRETIDGAKITLKGTTYGNISIKGGYFKFQNIAEDKYTLSINAEGYTAYEQVVNLKADLDLGIIYLVKYGATGTGSAIQQTIRATNITNLFNQRPNFIGGNMIYGIPPQPTEIEGDNYLDTKWNTASLLLYKDQKMLEGYSVRYNITSNSFEMLAPQADQITMMAGLRIQNLVWVDSTTMIPRYFVNGMDFLNEGSPISGFFEVIVDGKLPLMRRTMAVFKESNYNTALMMGNQNHQIIKRNIYYYLEGKNITEVPTNRKKLFELFDENAEEMKDYVNSNALSIRDPNTLFNIFTFYNSKFADFKPILNQLMDLK